MKNIKKGQNTWQAKWEPNFDKPISTTKSIATENVKNIAYATQLQIAEKPSVETSVPEVNWDLGKEWVADSISNGITGIKKYVKKKIYKPEGITVDHFSVALTQGAKYAKQLLNRGYNINKQDIYGNTIFMVACQNFKREWIDFLLDAGADVNITNNENETPLMYICKNSSLEVKGKLPISEELAKKDIEKLVEQNQSRKDIAFDTFNMLVSVGADLNIQSKKGYNALLYAVRRGNTDIVQRAIELGADINCVTNDGLTALDIAIDNNYIMTSQLLFQLDENQYQTLLRIQDKFPSNPKFVKFFEILYRNNLEEQIKEEYKNNGEQGVIKNFSFLNKKS